MVLQVRELDLDVRVVFISLENSVRLFAFYRDRVVFICLGDLMDIVGYRSESVGRLEI